MFGGLVRHNTASFVSLRLFIPAVFCLSPLFFLAVAPSLSHRAALTSYVILEHPFSIINYPLSIISWFGRFANQGTPPKAAVFIFLPPFHHICFVSLRAAQLSHLWWRVRLPQQRSSSAKKSSLPSVGHHFCSLHAGVFELPLKQELP
jgi:hypothetical protein